MRVRSTFKQIGKPLKTFFKYCKEETSNRIILEHAADLALEEFIKASPTDDIANNWSYSITTERNKTIITFNNTADIVTHFHYNAHGNLDEAAKSDVNVAIIIDSGHATGDGKWIEGKHYLHDATNNACAAITDYLRKEMHYE